tara:strand:- start:2614 stop:3408 length:795 start_codon:yes stop_codon:yes gene_type:complete
MAYPKITVNTGIVRPVYASDTVLIPSPEASLLTGTATSLLTGTADGNTLDHLIDTSDPFLSAAIPLPIVIGDLAMNLVATLEGNVTNVLAGDLTLDADAFPGGTEAYNLTRPLHLIDTSETFVTKGVQVGDIVRNTTNTSTTLPFLAYVTAVNNEVDLTLSVNLFGTITDFSSNYVIYRNPNGNYGGSAALSSSEGCLLYVTSATAVSSVTTSYVENIRVLTVAGDDITFENVPVGSYLPVQIRQLFSTTTTPASRGGVCLGIW